MNLKRVVLAIMTAVSLLSVIFALSQSLSEPQVQAQLELYQTDLILHVAQLENSDINSEENENVSINALVPNIIGTKPYEVAEQQYQKTIEITQNSLQDLEVQADQLKTASQESPRQLLKKSIRKNEDLLDELKTKLGIIYSYENKLDLAQENWQAISNSNPELLNTLNYLWVNQEANSHQIKFDRTVLENIDFFFDGWFKNINLAQFYKLTNNQDQLDLINQQQQQLGYKAIYRLISLSIIPVVGSILGSGLIIFLLVQLLLKKEQAI